MAFKPNYRQQRNDRAHAKERRKQEKLQRRNEEAAKRKGEREDVSEPDQMKFEQGGSSEFADGQEEDTGN